MNAWGDKGTFRMLILIQTFDNMPAFTNSFTGEKDLYFHPAEGQKEFTLEMYQQEIEREYIFPQLLASFPFYQSSNHTVLAEYSDEKF